MGKKNESKRGYIEKHPELFLSITAIIWGSTFIIVQNALNDIGVFRFLFFRFFLAFIFMLIIFYKKISLKKEAVIAAFLLGLFNFTAFATQTFGLLYTSSSIVGLITGLYVIFTPFLAMLIFKEKVKPHNIIGAFLAFFGMYLLTSGNLNFSLGIGEILTLICAIVFALHIVFTEIYARKYNNYTLVTFQFLFVSLFSLLLFPTEKPKMNFSFNVILALIITSLFATAFAYYVQTTAQKYISATKTAIIYALEPLSATFLGITMGEKLTIKQIIGAIIIVISTIISEIGDKLRIKSS